MNFLRVLSSLIMVRLMATPNLALALARGGSDTGGGSLVHCQEPSKGDRLIYGPEHKLHLIRRNMTPALKHNRKFQFLDLFIAEHGLGPFEDKPVQMAPPNSELIVEKYLERALSRLKAVHPQLAFKVSEYLSANRLRMKPIPQGNYVQEPRDARLLHLPIGCDPIGFGVFDDRRNILYFDPILRDELTNMDFAAFEFHEAVYKYFRDAFKHSTSWDTQRVVGLAFSEYNFTLEDLIDDMKELRE